MDDLISKEIKKNRIYISEYGLIKYYEKSKYLSKVWQIFNEKFEETYSIISKIEPTAFDDTLKKDLLINSFMMIQKELRNNFDYYFTKKKIILKEKKHVIGKESIVILDRTFGSKTKQYTLLENEAKDLVGEYFLLSYGFMLPLLKILREKNLITQSELEKMEMKANAGRTYDFNFMKKIKEIETTEKPKPKQFQAIIKANKLLKKYNESDLICGNGFPTQLLINIRDSYKVQKKDL